MNRDEAKEVLLRYRPGTPDAEEPDVQAALEMAREDFELAKWLQAHTEFQKSVREQLRAIRPPADLKARILEAHEARIRIVWLRSPGLWAAAAAIVLLLSLGLWWTRPQEDQTFAGFRERMVRTVLRDYPIQLLTPDLGEIRRYLAAQQVHSDYELPRKLEQVRGYGCAVLSWQNHKVAMVCFEPSAGQQLYLFVANEADVPRAPDSPTPGYQRVNRLATAVWTRNGKLYLLAAEGDEATLSKYLGP